VVDRSDVVVAALKNADPVRRACKALRRSSGVVNFPMMNNSNGQVKDVSNSKMISEIFAESM
jgi:hypothetical protein